MQVGGVEGTADDDDDFTYTEDASGAQTKVAVEKEFVFKVVVLGDYSVGKTCLIKRMLAVHSLAPSTPPYEDSEYAESSDDDDHLGAVTPTVGTDFYSLALPHVLPGISLRLQLWDTAGLTKYAAKYENTFRNASFVVCVFDVTSASSLHDVVDRHLSIAAEHIPELDQSNIMVVANKIDVLHDMEDNTAALRDARKRARSPEMAFAAGSEDDDTATNTEFYTAVDGIDRDAIVTAKKVQAEVFDLFSEVHYAEVSAKTRQNVRSMLQTLAFALLRNTPEASERADVPVMPSTYDVFARTVLPMQRPGSSPTRKGAPLTADAPITAAGLPPPALAPPPPPPPPPMQPAASWRTTGAFQFDMAASQLASTAVFTPIEGPDEPHARSGGSLRNSIRSPDIPSPGAATVAAPPSVSNSSISALRLDEVQVEVSARRKTARAAPPDPNETPQARKAREQAEMNALLGRAGQRKGGQPSGAAAVTTVASDALRNDADKMEDDVASGRERVNDNAARQSAPSILDSLGMQDDKNKAGGRAAAGADDDDDEDGGQMHARLNDRFAQIEHDIRQDNAVAKERAKKEKKTKGKCKCVLM
ncbi:putative ras-like small GTPase [Leptomonas pyrrhocoris]|uniref:Putative ras-like small GTPase n=1 Tax=Leptomonas pyrrhocoris TaxID=157538 RepID=A0A0N1J4P9_LEPPY|nr:putative ras-like small GTPase [Leptomonas pyrrhocoris]KPA78978.1 putative ras-like small GTPase [Leptomonas pyrrhocoris]|eukprot:XP_015657417.1 putative ras-like small GTPase [Leptomonas pyrrhocoris]